MSKTYTQSTIRAAWLITGHVGRPLEKDVEHPGAPQPLNKFPAVKRVAETIRCETGLPELLAALEHCLGEHADLNCVSVEELLSEPKFAKARAAIAKARMDELGAVTPDTTST